MRKGKNRGYVKHDSPDKPDVEPAPAATKTTYRARITCQRCGRVQVMEVPRSRNGFCFIVCSGCGENYKKTKEQLDGLRADSVKLRQAVPMSHR